jgi:hypothetical protein
VPDSEPVQPVRPFLEVFSAIHQKLQVIEARLELAEALAGMSSVTDLAEDELTLRLNESDVTHLTVLTYEVVQHF